MIFFLVNNIFNQKLAILFSFAYIYIKMSCETSIEHRSVYLSSKKARSQVDEETKSLENRIRMVRFEESRALKRIQETRERISEVYKTRTRYLEDKHHKNILKEKEQKEIEETKEAIRSYRNFHDEKRTYLKNEMFNINQNIGKRVRGWKEYIRRNRQQQAIDSRRENRKIKEAVVIMGKQGAMRLKLLDDFKEQKAKANYVRRVEIENTKRLETEKQLNNMGREEQMLMERLKNIHEMQKQTVEELEKVYI